MGISRRIRTIAISQINAIKDRLDRIDAEEDEALAQRRDRDMAVDELKDPADIRLPAQRRTPEEIAAGVPAASRPITGGSEPPAGPPGGPLATQYRILGLQDGADLESVEAAYQGLAARCSPDRFPAESSEREAASEIFKRVDSAYNTLKEALDPTVGRFDKLEL